MTTIRKLIVLAAALTTATPGAASQPAEETADMAATTPNRLADETSPYLLQHAHNPVDWYPWGPEAFQAARERNVPIFLSIGYSTCYWCHVMERESFEDEETAALMNEHFVCIKVDREERPDIDEIYMAATQIANDGRGGWPMSVWLTPPGAEGPDDPGLKPFVCATYLARPQFQAASRNISNYWTTQRQGILDQANRISDFLREQFAAEAAPVAVGPDTIGAAVGFLIERMHDPDHGGFGQPPQYAPKFPQPVFLEFLLDTVENLNDEAYAQKVNQAIRLTLDRMALGGMYDQVGGGFHRYSVDARWVVPHFEKMLYDNAQLARLYTRASVRYNDPFYERVAREIFRYVHREMTDETTGAFYSAQDAEVDAREGLNYLWTQAQFEEVLGAEDAAFAAAIYSVDLGPNFQDPHHTAEPPANVLVMAARPADIAAGMDVTPEAFEARERAIDARLYQVRNLRPQPGLDDKILAGWNGLMIGAYADGARLLADPELLARARRAADYILKDMRTEEGDLLRSARRGDVRIPAFLEDYAMVIDGLLAIHLAGEALNDRSLTYLDEARALAERADALFADPQLAGVWYDTRADQSDLLFRTRAQSDGAIPAGSSVMLGNWLTLHEITGDRRYLRRAVDQLGAESRMLARRDWPVAKLHAGRTLHRILQLDETLVGEFAATADAAPPQRDVPVEVWSDRDRVAVTRDTPGVVRIQLRIDKGYHINAHDPGVEGMVPLSVGITNGAGVRATADFPAGARLGKTDLGDEFDALMVHEGEVVLTITLERTDEAWSGRPIITLTYQACTDTMCLEPLTVELDVAVDPQ